MFIYFTSKRMLKKIGIQKSMPKRAGAARRQPVGLARQRGIGIDFCWTQRRTSAFKAKSTFHRAVKYL